MVEDEITVLKRCPLFSGIDPDELLAMLDCLQVRRVTVEKNGFVFREGDAAEYVGIVLSGAVQIVREDYYGNRSILGVSQAGEIFGEAYACTGIQFLPVSVMAAQKSRIMLADCKRIITGCGHSCTFHSKMINNLLQVVAEKNMQLSRKLELMSKKTTREKLLSYLLEQAKIAGSPNFTIPFDRQQLADYLGAERSALSAEISRMRKDGIFLCEKSRFTLLMNGEKNNGR